jgi:hypothetical protein
MVVELLDLNAFAISFQAWAAADIALDKARIFLQEPVIQQHEYHSDSFPSNIDMRTILNCLFPLTIFSNSSLFVSLDRSLWANTWEVILTKRKLIEYVVLTNRLFYKWNLIYIILNIQLTTIFFSQILKSFYLNFSHAFTFDNHSGKKQINSLHQQKHHLTIFWIQKTLWRLEM